MTDRSKQDWHYPQSHEEKVLDTLTKILHELELIRKLLKEK